MSGLAVVTAARRYRSLLIVPGVKRITVPSVIGRLPYGMTTLLFVIAVQHGTGSYAVAGLATAMNSALTAVTAPWLGRLADRGKAPELLTICGLGNALTLCGMVFALMSHAPAPAVVAIAGLAGATSPPIGAVTRVVLPRVAPDLAGTAYALDTILVELTYVLGPALIAAIAAAGGPYAAVFVTALLSAAGSVGLASAPAARYNASGVSSTESSVSRPRLFSFALAGLVLAGAFEAAAYGVMEVAIPAYASDMGQPNGAGAVIAAWSAGSIIGGVWFSGLTPKMSKWRLFALLCALNTAGFAAVTLSSGLLSLGATLFLGGLVIAPTTTVEIALVTLLVPASRRTEAFTWTSTGVFVGYSCGAALAGAVAAAGGGLTAATVVATGFVTAAALLATTLWLRARPARRRTAGNGGNEIG
jgi:MFS family permease